MKKVNQNCDIPVQKMKEGTVCLFRKRNHKEDEKKYDGKVEANSPTLERLLNSV